MPSGRGDPWPPPRPFDPFDDHEPLDEQDAVEPLAAVPVVHDDLEPLGPFVSLRGLPEARWDDPLWDVGEAADPSFSVDRTPTGELPIIAVPEVAPALESGATPTLPRLRRRVRGAVIVLAFVTPVALLVVGLGLIGLGLGKGDSTTTATIAPTPVTSPRGATTASGPVPSTIGVTGDPLDAATALLDELVNDLRAGDVAAASRLAPGTDRSVLTKSLGGLADLRTKLARVRSIGPNAFRMRLAMFPGAPPIGTVKGGCYDWDVDPATHQIKMVATVGFGTARSATLDGAALVEALAAECAAASLS